MGCESIVGSSCRKSTKPLSTGFVQLVIRSSDKPYSSAAVNPLLRVIRAVITVCAALQSRTRSVSSVLFNDTRRASDERAAEREHTRTLVSSRGIVRAADQSVLVADEEARATAARYRGQRAKTHSAFGSYRRSAESR